MIFSIFPTIGEMREAKSMTRDIIEKITNGPPSKKTKSTAPKPSKIKRKLKKPVLFPFWERIKIKTAIIAVIAISVHCIMPIFNINSAYVVEYGSLLKTDVSPPIRDMYLGLL